MEKIISELVFLSVNLMGQWKCFGQKKKYAKVAVSVISFPNPTGHQCPQGLTVI